MRTGDFETRATRDGFRLSQHGVVLSELRLQPGPTHSVFDVLAATAAALAPTGRIGLLGFAGGSMLAPLRALEAPGRVEGVDLDRTGYDLFLRHCAGWAGDLAWHQADAVSWLRRQGRPFDLLIDDLSLPAAGDVVKPDISWSELPDLMRRRLAPGGAAVMNLLPPPGGASWGGELRRLVRPYRRAVIVCLDEFENRILIAAAKLPAARSLAADLHRHLARLQSRQAGRIHLRTLR